MAISSRNLLSFPFQLSLLFSLIFLASCQRTKVQQDNKEPSQKVVQTEVVQKQPSAPSKTLLFLGDSLTAGYGVSREEAFPMVVQQLLQERLSHPVQVINGGQSGALSSSSLENLNFYLGRVKPDLIVLTTGGNDARQGTAATVIKNNIARALKKAQEDNKKVLLGGMKIFPNLGKEYSEAFAQIYPDLAREFSVPLIPFLLEGVAGEVEYNQYDGFHPNEKGHKKIADHILPFILEALK